MMNVRKLAAIAAFCLGLMVAASAAHAVAIASDNASDPAYADGWEEGDNGGSGFLPWTGGMYGNPVAIDSGSPEPDNDLGAPAFQFGTGGSGYWAIRPFATPIQPSQSFKLDFDPFAFSVPDPPEFVYLSNDSLIRFDSTAGWRFRMYNWLAKYNDGGQITNYGADEWAIGATTAFDNLNGGAALPTGGAGFLTGYTGPDSQDGFSMTLDIITIDTYRVLIVDDGVTKVDVSGQLRDLGTAGQEVDQLVFWSQDATASDIDSAYFNNLLIESTAGLPGDYNSDSVVDAADYTVWRDNLGTTNSLPNDSIGGTIGVAHYSQWKNNFGMGGSGAGIGGIAIPEPATCFVMLSGALGGMLLMRRGSGSGARSSASTVRCRARR